MFRKARSKICNGFTLIELLVVVCIIGILAAILLPALSAVVESSRKKSCAADIQQMKAALTVYEQFYRDFPPSTLRELGILQSNAVNEGIEAWVACLSGAYRDRSYFEFHDRNMINADGDFSPIALKRLTTSIFETNELFEWMDPWENPLVYFHGRDIVETTSHSYLLQGEKKKVKPDMKKTKTGRIRGAGQFQIFSCGADGIPHTEDDVSPEN